MTNFDKSIDEEALREALSAPFKDDDQIQKILHEGDLKFAKYLEETKDMFSSSPEQMKKHFTI